MRLRYVDYPELERIRSLDLEPVERAAAFADACRINILYEIAYAGSGHLGTSFSCMDILSWLHLEVLGEGDRYFSSKGHDAPALYAVLIGLGRIPFEKLHGLRRLGGLPGHPDVLTTPQVVTNTGSLGMGISKARGFVLADRLAGRKGRVFVLTGDGELQEGQFWESLQPTANRGPRRDHGDRRPQQDPVGHVGLARLRPRRPRGEGRRLRLGDRALRRQRPPRRRRRARAARGTTRGRS